MNTTKAIKSDQGSIKDLLVIDKLIVGPAVLEKNRIITEYKVVQNGKSESTELIYKYEDSVLDPDKESFVNLANIITAQVALNYGLFCREIIFRGLFDDVDKKLITEWMDNTSKEIYVKKILEENPFLIGKAKNLTAVKLKSYTQAKIIFEDTSKEPVKTKWEYWNTDLQKYTILSSGGKDSLLSYGLLNEIGKEIHPIFINESGRHWFTALNAYKKFKSDVPNTSRVWVNSDRVFNWMLKHLSFIRPDFNTLRADMYPIRLWTVAVFLFGALPIMRAKGVGRLVIGDEYDTTIKKYHEGILHYDGLYDQSRYFDDSMSRYFMRKGWAVSQFSILRPVSELSIQTILATRYPELQKLQVSCHAAHKEEEIIKPCGKCEKCRRIVGMLMAIDADPANCGYNKEQIKYCLNALKAGDLHQEEEGVEHLKFLLKEKNLIEFDEKDLKKIRERKEVVSLRFDNDKSTMNYIPKELRRALYNIYLEHTLGAYKKVNKKWIETDIFSDAEYEKPYPFEFTGKKSKKVNLKNEKLSSKYLWAELTWQEAEEKLKTIDIAILPVGAIEQHGPHLPLDVDAFDAEYLANQVAAACSEPKPLVLPLIPYGVSYHHEEFAGTISISNNTLASLIHEIGLGLARQGIRKLVIINGHGDNKPTLNYAAQMINRDTGIFVAVDTGESSDTDLDDISSTPNDIHAGEIETSTTLALRPSLVKMDKAEENCLSFSSRYLNFSSLRGVPWYSKTKSISSSGVMGDPTKASFEKGEKIWKIMIAHLVGFIEDLKSLDPDQIHQKRY
ncbi:MAG: creatininase family protein [Bacteroidetes bacterium]|nr:creatininase family protein [Bacteroidota bacterium]